MVQGGDFTNHNGTGNMSKLYIFTLTKVENQYMELNFQMRISNISILHLACYLWLMQDQTQMDLNSSLLLLHVLGIFQLLKVII